MGGLRIGGLASGLDVDGLVRQLMTMERRPVRQLELQRDNLTSQAGAWRDINSRLNTLRSRASDLVASAAFSAKRVTVGDPAALKATVETGATAGIFDVTINSLATATAYKSTVNDISNPATDLNEVGVIKIINTTDNTVRGSFSIAAGDSLNDIASTINNNKDLKVNASVVQTEPNVYRLVITGNQTGSTGNFDFQVESGGAWARLGFLAEDGEVPPNRLDLIRAGANASLTVNGLAISSASNDVKDAIPGVTLTLLKEGQSTAVEVQVDVEKTISAIKQFVDQYNSVQEFMGAQMQPGPTGRPATLAGEGTLLSLRNTLRQMTVDPVNGLSSQYKTLGSIGIATAPFAAGTAISGKLQVDETKLREALKTDPDAVAGLFQASSGGEGVAVRTEQWLGDYTRSNGVLLRKAESIDTSVKRVQERIRQYDEIILPKREQTMRARFDALERVLATLQGQGSWLSAQLSGLNANNNG